MINLFYLPVYYLFTFFVVAGTSDRSMEDVIVRYIIRGQNIRNKIILANNIINNMAIVMSGNSNIMAHVRGRQDSSKFNKFTI